MRTHYYSDDITANIKAFIRPHCLSKCITACIGAGIDKILIGDDGPDNCKKEHREIVESFRETYDNLQIEHHEYPFNLGLSAVRNRLAALTDTKYLFLLDDDNYIPSNSLNIISFFDGVDKSHRYAGVGLGWIMPSNQLWMDAYDIKIERGYLKRYIDGANKKSERINDCFFIYPFSFIPNCAIYRTETFDDIQWDERYKIHREHEDFMLKLKRTTDWKLAICPSHWAIHEAKKSGKYKEHRHGVEYRKSAEYFLEKWNLEGVYPTSNYARWIDTGREESWLQRLQQENTKKYKGKNIYEE